MVVFCVLGDNVCSICLELLEDWDNYPELCVHYCWRCHQGTHWSCQLDCDGGRCPLCRAVQPDVVSVQGTRRESCLEYVDVCHGSRRCFAGFRDGVPLNEEFVFLTEVWEDEEGEVLQRRRQLLEDAAWYFEESRRREEWERAERKRARRRRYRSRRAERLN